MRGFHLILILAGFMLIFGCIEDRQQPPAPAQEGPRISVIGAETGGGEPPAPEEMTDAQWAQKAIEERNAYYCLKVSIERQEACLLPLSNISVQNCMMLGLYGNERVCLWHHARTSRDISICDMLRGDEVLECVRELSPPCTMEPDEVSRGRCYAFLNNNSAHCRDDQCFFDFAMEKKDASACAGMENHVKKAVCEGIIEGTDPCPSFSESNRNLCYYMMALGRDNPSHCYSINGLYETEIAYQCFFHFALRDGNKDMCNALELNNRWKCLTEYAMEKKDLGACQAIDRRANLAWNLCFDGFARKFYQASACNHLPDGAVVQVNCYAFVVMASPELELWDCGNIYVKEWRDRCYMNMAGQKNDATYCNYMEDASMRQLCISRI